MRSMRYFNMGLAAIAVVALTGQVFAASQIAYTLEVSGDNHAADWKAGTKTLFTSGTTADGTVFWSGTPLTYAVRIAASGVHSQAGHASNGYAIYGAANIVFNLELHQGTETGPLATGATFYSSINNGSGTDPTANAAFALGFNFNGPGRLVDTLIAGGPRMEPIFTYPTAQPGKLIGQGAGYKEWNRTGTGTTITTPGVGMTTLPNSNAGLGVGPIAEGQINLTGLAAGTYVLKVIPGTGNNVLRGDTDMSLPQNKAAFAVAANGTVGDTITFVVTSQAPCMGVQGRYVFYNNSWFDINGGGDDAAIATNKTALLPGQQGSLSNVISYDRSINGIMIDVCPLSRAPQADLDLYFTLGNTDNPESWTTTAPNPTVTWRPGAGVGGSDRVVLTWADNAIPNTKWLMVYFYDGDGTLGFNGGLDMFCFGIAKGESSGDLIVNATDELAARTNRKLPPNYQTITNMWDFNRDRLVNATDELVSRNNRNLVPTTALKKILWP